MNKKNRTSYGQSQMLPRQFRWGWLLVGLALVLVASGGLLLWRSFQAEPDFVPEVSGAPRLAVDQTTLDTGDVKFETPIQSAFRLRNVGDKPLQLLGEPQVELIEGC